MLTAPTYNLPENATAEQIEVVRARLLEVHQEMTALDVAMSKSRSRVDDRGRRLSWDAYYRWKERAIEERAAKLLEYRTIKEWVKSQQRRLDQEEIRAVVGDDGPDTLLRAACRVLQRLDDREELFADERHVFHAIRAYTGMTR